MTCPTHPDELADSYCLHHLLPDAARAFDAHFLTCPNCAQAVERAQDFIEVLRIKARGEAHLGGSGTGTAKFISGNA